MARGARDCQTGPTIRAEGTIMQLELNDEEVAALRRALDSAFKELTSEIADTDNASYRQGLATYRDSLRTIAERLGQ